MSRLRLRSGIVVLFCGESHQTCGLRWCCPARHDVHRLTGEKDVELQVFCGNLRST
jgi:hypothetical protein